MSDVVLILAAGKGSRLQPITQDIPKALVRVDGQPLIRWQLNALKETGYPEESIFIVGGHRSSSFRSHGVVPDERLMVFEEYETVNNVGTLAFALERLEPPVLVVNSDTLFSRKHLALFQGSERLSELLYDPTTPPGKEAMKIEQDNGKLVRISKDLTPADADGEYIGLVRIGTAAYTALLNACRQIRETDPDAWYESAIAHICPEFEFRCQSIGELPWIEIDDHEDLASASDIAQQLS